MKHKKIKNANKKFQSEDLDYRKLCVHMQIWFKVCEQGCDE